MFDHVTIGASDREASRRFYATVLGALGSDPEDFSIQQAGDGRAVTTRLHIGFAAPSRDAVDAFWQAGVDAGYASDGEPGPRPEYLPDYYGAFLLDPDGNSAEAVVHGDAQAVGVIDHLWWRVADLGTTRRFYAAVGEDAGFAQVNEVPDRVAYSPGPGRGTFSIVGAAETTTPFHLAFPARRAAVLRDPDGHTVELVRR